MEVSGSQEKTWEYTEVRKTSDIWASRTQLPPVSDPSVLQWFDVQQENFEFFSLKNVDGARKITNSI